MVGKGRPNTISIQVHNRESGRTETVFLSRSDSISLFGSVDDTSEEHLAILTVCQKLV